MKMSTTVLAITATLAGPGAAAHADDGVFSIIGLPDTQNYSQSFPFVFVDQTSWVADQIDTLDIRFVTHYGDLVQRADREEWINADDAMVLLGEAGVPRGVASGNPTSPPTAVPASPTSPRTTSSTSAPTGTSGGRTSASRARPA